MECAKLVGYNGECPICGSADGMIQFGKDEKYRNICRVMGCKAYYIACPSIGFDKIEDVRNPYESELLKSGVCSIREYIYGNKKKCQE